MRTLAHIFIVISLIGFAACSDSDQGSESDTKVAAPQRGPKIEVSASVDKPQVDIGARVKYRVEVKFREGVEIDWPPILEQLNHQVVYDVGIWTEGDPIGNYRVRSMEVELDPGIDEVLKIDPTVIRWRETEEQDWDEVKTDAITVEVLSLAEGAPELQEPLDTFELPKAPNSGEQKNHTTVLILVGAALGVLALAAFLLLRQKKKKQLPQLTPEEIATQELDHLDSLNLLAAGRVKEFYYRLTAIIRRYIELRFRIMASEQTTEEFLASMKNDSRLNEDEKEILQGFLKTADLVRYALHEPPTADVQASMIMARGFVDRLPLSESEMEMADAV